MSFVTTVYNLTPNTVFHDDGTTEVILIYNGIPYSGTATLHKEDEGFFSRRVGTTIAQSKARIEILKDGVAASYQEWKNKETFYNEVCTNKDPSTVDPTGSFLTNVTRARDRFTRYSLALTKEKSNLKYYLDGQAKALDSVNRFRKKYEANNI